MEAADVTTVLAGDDPLPPDLLPWLRQVAELTGRAPLSESKRMAVTTVATDGDRTPGATMVGAATVRSGDTGALLGFAPVVGEASGHVYAVEVVVDPRADHVDGQADALVDAVVAVVTGRGGGTLRLWVSHATAADDARAAGRGLRRERDLLQMRCPLPLDGAVRGREAPATRPFRPGRDEEVWLAVNNRAFATHPEQGNWTVEDIRARQREPWFDPDGLLLVEADGRVAGSCWTKVHADAHPPMGEIYVIGVDPDYQGRGWGRALTEAGLDWLAERGLTVGMLYVDADNVAAVSLYRSMGFTEDHVDRAYVGTFP